MNVITWEAHTFVWFAFFLSFVPCRGFCLSVCCLNFRAISLVLLELCQAPGIAIYHRLVCKPKPLTLKYEEIKAVQLLFVFYNVLAPKSCQRTLTHTQQWQHPLRCLTSTYPCEVTPADDKHTRSLSSAIFEEIERRIQHMHFYYSISFALVLCLASVH